jgi:flagellar basal body rod protein FlgG
MSGVGAQVSASLEALGREFDIIAHNLANVSTVGYKRRCNRFTKVLEAQTQQAGEEDSTSGIFDFSQGRLVQTDRTLDLALYGKGFFVIETPDGPLYTRHGVFRTDETGQVVDAAGRLVAGEAGPVVIPEGIDLSQVYVGEDGRISAGPTDIGQFRLVEFPEEQDQLVPAGQNCFQAPEDVDPVEAVECLIKQGYQEASNVRLTDELVNMITVTRMYEANTRLLNVKRDASRSMMSVAMG